MIIYENLYKPNKIAREKDKYPTSTYELDGFTSYSWKNNVPKNGDEIDKSKLSYCWNGYIGSVKIPCTDTTGTLTFQNYNELFKKVDIDNENNSITFTGVPGTYELTVNWQPENEELEPIDFNYIFTIYANATRQENLNVQNYLNDKQFYDVALEQFNSTLAFDPPEDDPNVIIKVLVIIYK